MAWQLLLDIICIGLAVNQLCETWLLGDIFAGTRAKMEAWQDPHEKHVLSRADTTRAFFADLVLCPYCLSHHLTLWVVIVCWLPTFWCTTCAAPYSMIPIYGLTALRIATALMRKGNLPPDM
jgi:hypothetical protein